MQITKRNGRIVVFDNDKITDSILKANAEVAFEQISRARAESIAEEVFQRVTEQNEIITTGDVTKSVWKLLNEMNYTETAKHYKAVADSKR